MIEEVIRLAKSIKEENAMLEEIPLRTMAYKIARKTKNDWISIGEYENYAEKIEKILKGEK